MRPLPTHTPADPRSAVKPGCQLADDPLREEEDRLAVIEGLRDGTIDAIITDHAPTPPREKANFETAPNGIIGLETSFAASYTSGSKTGVLSLMQLIRLMSTNP